MVENDNIEIENTNEERIVTKENIDWLKTVFDNLNENKNGLKHWDSMGLNGFIQYKKELREQEKFISLKTFHWISGFCSLYLLFFTKSPFLNIFLYLIIFYCIVLITEYKKEKKIIKDETVEYDKIIKDFKEAVIRDENTYVRYYLEYNLDEKLLSYTDDIWYAINRIVCNYGCFKHALENQINFNEELKNNLLLKAEKSFNDSYIILKEIYNIYIIEEVSSDKIKDKNHTKLIELTNILDDIADEFYESINKISDFSNCNSLDQFTNSFIIFQESINVNNNKIDSLHKKYCSKE